MKASVQMMPLVSVCIPVYNRIKYIQETIVSILGQNYPNLEIVVQDNASTDGTWETLQSLARQHSQLSIERNESNLGPIPNWNRAMSRARGDYCMWLSSDDLLEPGFIASCMETFQKYNIDVVTTNFYILEDGCKNIRRKKLPAGIYESFYDRLLTNPMLFTINFTLLSRKVVDELSVNKNLMHKNLMACDYDLWFRLSLAGKRVYYLDHPLGSYRIHDDNDSKRKNKLRRHTAMVILAHREKLKRCCKSTYKLILFRYLIRMLRPATWDKRLFQVLAKELC